MATAASGSEPPSRDFTINRRRFLNTAAGALAFSALGAYGVDLVNRKARRVGLIGTGWYGKSDLWRLAQVAPIEVVGLCDPDRQMLAGAAELARERLPGQTPPRTYSDYREMLTKERPEIVVVGSPDHWHALHAIAAIEAGADVYLQKPISVDVLEGEAIVAAARRHGRVVQVGLQRRSTPHFHEVRRQVLEAGLLGKVGHVSMCCYYPRRPSPLPPIVPVPEHFDYEMWTGPAPLRPFEGLPHRRWRAFMEYGNGTLGDMGVHMLDAAQWLLGLGWPKHIHSAGGIRVRTNSRSNTSDTQIATFDYDSLTCVWEHRNWGVPVDTDYPWALFLHGEKGVLKASTRSADFIPSESGGKQLHFDCRYEREEFPEDLEEEGIELHAAPATRRQMLDFLAAIDRRSRPVADIELGHISSASCILANISMQTGRALTYDPASRTVPGDLEATRLLARPYREPWQRPQVV